MKKWIVSNLLTLAALLLYLTLVAYALHNNESLYRFLAHGEVFGFYVSFCEWCIEPILEKWLR